MNRDQFDSEAEARFHAVYHRHSSAVMAYALRRCDPDDAADVVSETFVVVWRRLEAMPEESSVRPWLFGVARRVLANQRRGNRRRSELVRKASTYLAPRFHDVSAFERIGTEQIAIEALQQLPERDQELLKLVAWEELTPSEIAVVLGVSGAVVRKRLFRARKRLADAAKKIDEERDAYSGHVPEKADPEFLRPGRGVRTP